MAKVAVVLSGCGFLDGSEIHEAVSVLIHLDAHAHEVTCFAPDQSQSFVVNHATKAQTGETRNMLAESARISRGKITPLANLKASAFDAIVFPGGFGAAKNLSSFGVHGADCKVLPDVARVVKEFHAARKPMAFCCIAPVIPAKVLGTGQGGPGVSVTLGNDVEVIGAVARMGSTHVAKTVEETHIDVDHRIVSTPAYMYDTSPAQVFHGVGKMILGLNDLLAQTRTVPPR